MDAMRRQIHNRGKHTIKQELLKSGFRSRLLSRDIARVGANNHHEFGICISGHVHYKSVISLLRAIRRYSWKISRRSRPVAQT